MSQERQKDHQGQQPPEPLPVHPVTFQKVRSVQVHQRWDREAEKQLAYQGHQTVKQPSLAQGGCCLHTDLKSLATLINGTLVTLIMSTYLALLISYVYTVFYTIYCILVDAALLIHIFIYSYSIPLPRLCVLGIVVKLLDITC
jgi:hypothetical protein